MRLLVLAALAVSAAVGQEFDPQAAMRALIEGAKEMQADVDRQSSAIDKKLRSVTRHKESSFMQTQSLASIAKEISDFQKTKSALLENDLKAVNSRKEFFETALRRLKRDSAELRSHGSSFLEKPVDVSDFFEGPKKMASKVHNLVQSFKEGSDAPAAVTAVKKVSSSFDLEGLNLE